jgi:6-phosphogluconate dehydrogenase
MQDAAGVKAKGMHYMDAGTSGGIWGLEYGYCLMVGAEKEIYDHCMPLLKDLAPDDGGLVHTGAEGSGHFVKMVHNGVEYGLMQAYAEGFDLMRHKKEFNLDLLQIAEIWRFGSVIRSWLLDLTAAALRDNPTMAGIAPYVTDSGEGRWTAIEGIELGVPLPVIAASLDRRFISQDPDPYSNKLLAMMRHEFGGHAVHEEATKAAKK